MRNSEIAMRQKWHGSEVGQVCGFKSQFYNHSEILFECLSFFVYNVLNKIKVKHVHHKGQYQAHT